MDTSSINSARSKSRNTSTSNLSDSNSTGLNFLLESSTSRSSKPKRRTTTKELKGLIKRVDDPTDHPNDFSIKSSLRKDLVEYLQKLKDCKTECQKIMNMVENNCKTMDSAAAKTKMEKILKEAHTTSVRAVETFAEIHKYNSEQALRRCCRVIKGLEKGHCKGLLHIHDISKELPFIYDLINQINTRMNRPMQYCDDSSTDQFDFSMFKLDATCPRQVEECSDDHSNILKSTIGNNFNAFDLDQITDSNKSIQNKVLSNVVSLIQQYNFFSAQAREKQEAVKKVYKLLTKDDLRDFTAMNETKSGMSYQDGKILLTKDKEKLKEISTMEDLFDDIESEPLPAKSIEEVANDLVKSHYFNEKMNVIFNELSNLDTSLEFFKTKGPYNFLCALCNRDGPIHKSLEIYDEFIAIRKHLYNYVCQLKVSKILGDPDEAKCSDYNIFMEKSKEMREQLEDCKRSGKKVDEEGAKNGKFYAVYRILNKNFHQYFEFINT